ncbi:YtcA family lipoprotein [Martelella alba]|uniref:YtcA family lipoprotein n=1 Tax=Martelella alba TaxID=2590451 RepID=UPI001F31B9DF|nr:YtcA family lipoprotein [Martelella alba]
MIRFRLPIICLIAPLLDSCARASHGPAISLYGAYFPSWIASTLIGIIATVIIRLVLIKTGIDEILPLRVVVYFCLAIAIGLAASLSIFGR